jgi:flagellar FliJ protein
MKRFSFSMQKILDWRQYAEDQAKLDLGRAVSVVNRIEAELRNIAQNRVHAMLERTNEGSQNLNITAILAIEDYITLLDAKKEQLLTELVSAQLVVEQKREVFAEAMKKRSVLTKLSERQLEAYKEDELREEDKVLDEVGARMGMNVT